MSPPSACWLCLLACLLVLACEAKKSATIPSAGEVDLWAGNGDVSLSGVCCVFEQRLGTHTTQQEGDSGSERARMHTPPPPPPPPPLRCLRLRCQGIRKGRRSR